MAVHARFGSLVVGVALGLLSACDDAATDLSGMDSAPPIQDASGETSSEDVAVADAAVSDAGDADAFFSKGGPQAPTFQPLPTDGPFKTQQFVAITTTLPNATIYFTTDGTNPTVPLPGAPSTATIYTSPVPTLKSGAITIRAMAIAKNYPPSSVAAGTFVVTP